MDGLGNGQDTQRSSNMQTDMEKYAAIQEKLGFRTWWLEQSDSGIDIVLDGKKIDVFVRDKGIPFQFGAIIGASSSEDKEFVKGCKDTKTVLLYLMDFMSQCSPFSKRFVDSCYEADAFSRQLHSLMEDVATVDSKEIETEETTCSTDSAIAGTQFDAFLLDKELGSLKVPVQHLTLASDKKRVRPLDSDYSMKIVRATKESTINLAFPEAIGNVDTDIDDLSSIKEKIISGELVVEIIDGNHTTYAMQTLLKEFPDVERFQTRKVRLYKNLTSPEAFKLGIKGNEIASQARPTSDLDLMKIIRREMKNNFDGLVTQSFRRHVDNILDVKEDVSRQKRASEIIKIASMEDECWASLEDIYNRYPRQRSYIFNDLCQLCKEQALPLLRKVADGTLKPAALPYHSKLLPLPPADIPLIVQVGRKKEKNARTNQQLKKVKSKSPTHVSLNENQKMKTKVEELQKELSSKNQKLQELELQLAKERLEVKHLQEMCKMKDTTIKMLKDTSSALQNKQQTYLKEVDREHRPLNMDSLPFRLDLPVITNQRSIQSEVMTQPQSIIRSTPVNASSLVKRKNDMELELQLAKERLEVKHLQEMCKMKDTTIKMLKDTSSALQNKQQTYLKEVDREHRPLNMDSLPFRLDLPVITNQRSIQSEVMTQPQSIIRSTPVNASSLVKRKNDMELELQLAKERLEVKHLQEMCKMKDTTIKMLKDTSSALQNKQQTYLKEVDREHRPLNMDSLPFRLDLPVITNQRSIQSEVMTQPQSIIRSTPVNASSLVKRKNDMTQAMTNVTGAKTKRQMEMNQSPASGICSSAKLNNKRKQTTPKTQPVDRRKVKQSPLSGMCSKAKSTGMTKHISPTAKPDDGTKSQPKPGKKGLINSKTVEKTVTDTENMDDDEGTEFQIGDRVWALWGDEDYPDKYKATIIGKTVSTYEVVYDDDKARKTFRRPVISADLTLQR